MGLLSQVTEIRQDPWANAGRIAVEENKPASQRGTYAIRRNMFSQIRMAPHRWTNEVLASPHG